MENSLPNLTPLREAIIESLPAETSYSGRAPDLKNLYVPPAHVKALRLDCHLVIGARGVGKSVWTAALSDQKLRLALGATVKELEFTEVGVGFSEKPSINDYPDAGTFGLLLQDADSHTVWKAVVARWLAKYVPQSLPQDSWRDTVNWVRAEPEALARLVQNSSEYFQAQRKHGLIVFDALDRSSQQDWREMDKIVRGLLQTVLWLKPFASLSAKVFLRDDQFGRNVTDFPDASKLQATRAELTWAPHDLHGLLWQCFVNGQEPGGGILRQIYQDELRANPAFRDGVWFLSDAVKREAKLQRALFERLAGPWMGRDKRRGVPYIWAVSHLADGQGRTSPRSFLAAIRQAAEDSLERYIDHPLALHYESIKRGIQKASEIRVNEMAEDYKWIHGLMDPLSGLSVPCEYAQIIERWELEYPDGIEQSIALDGLPPQHMENSWDGIRDDLIRIGIFTNRKDGRLDMPDLYRVGFGLGRRGGVKPKMQSA